MPKPRRSTGTCCAEPDHAGTLHFLVMVLYQTRRTECAVAQLARAIALETGVADMHSNLGLMLAALQRPAEALIYYETAMALDPGHTGALFNRSLLLINQQRHTAALAAFGRAMPWRICIAGSCCCTGYAIPRLWPASMPRSPNGPTTPRRIITAAPPCTSCGVTTKPLSA